MSGKFCFTHSQKGRWDKYGRLEVMYDIDYGANLLLSFVCREFTSDTTMYSDFRNYKIKIIPIGKYLANYNTFYLEKKVMEYYDVTNVLLVRENQAFKPYGLFEISENSFYLLGS